MYFDQLAYFHTKLTYHNGYGQRKEAFPLQRYEYNVQPQAVPQRDYTERDIIDMFLGKPLAQPAGKDILNELKNAW